MARGAVVALMIGFLGAAAPVLGGMATPPAGATGATTPTTTPGPAPNQSQIDAAKGQVSAIESSLSQEEQQSAVLDTRYDTAVQDEQTDTAALAVISTKLVRTKSDVAVDKRRLTNDAIKAYIYGTPQSKFDSLFTTSGSLNGARDQYTQQIVGNLNQARSALQTSESHLNSQETLQQGLAAQAQEQANQAHTLAQDNQQETNATQATLSSVQGQLAQEVAQAAIAEAQQEAAAAAAASNAAQAQEADAAAQAAAAVAGEVGGSASGAAATTAANQAGGGVSPTGPVGGSGAVTGQGQAAVNAAESQLGVPYVWGGETAGVGFDCSGLVQWAWGQAGVSIPRTTETQWADLPQVSLDALEPGDLLLYYDLDGDNQVDHVVMYVGNNTVIQAPHENASVSYSPIWYSGLIGAVRP